MPGDKLQAKAKVRARCARVLREKLYSRVSQSAPEFWAKPELETIQSGVQLKQKSIFSHCFPLFLHQYP